MTQNNITDIEKCAKLMGYELIGDIFWNGDVVTSFNPRTNKVDLMDLECALGIDVEWDSYCIKNVLDEFIVASKFFSSPQIHVKDHPTKFAARAEAVIAVAVQIYDARFGKDGE